MKRLEAIQVKDGWHVTFTETRNFHSLNDVNDFIRHEGLIHDDTARNECFLSHNETL